MSIVLGVISDEEVALASRRALDGLLPLRVLHAAPELPGAVNAARPLVVVASHRDGLGDPVVPYLIEVRRLRPQIGVVLISDIAATAPSDQRLELSRLGEIRSVQARAREYVSNLGRAVEEQAERYRTEYMTRAFAPHTPRKLRPMLYYCARTWGRRLSVDDVAAALKHDRHTIARWVRAAQPACRLGDLLRLHHAVDITWEFCARGRPVKVLAQRFGYWPAAKLNARLRLWLGTDLRALGSARVQDWEALVDRLVKKFKGETR